MKLKNKNISTLTSGPKLKVLIIAAMCMTSVSAFAQEAPAIDYTEAIGEFTTAIQTFFADHGPLLLVGLIAPLAFGLVWKLLKRAVKSV